MERESVLKKSLKVIEHMKTQSFKKLSMRFLIDQKLDSINQKLHLIDPEAIEQRSKRADSN